MFSGHSVRSLCHALGASDRAALLDGNSFIFAKRRIGAAPKCRPPVLERQDGWNRVVKDTAWDVVNIFRAGDLTSCVSNGLLTSQLTPEEAAQSQSDQEPLTPAALLSTADSFRPRRRCAAEGAGAAE